MNKRIEIEEADNGYMITVYPGRKMDDDEYKEPMKMVARDDEEVLEVVKENLG